MINVPHKGIDEGACTRRNHRLTRAAVTHPATDDKGRPCTVRTGLCKHCGRTIARGPVYGVPAFA